MKTEFLFENIKKKESFLCVGLDSDINKIPAHLKVANDPVFEFNKSIINSTAKYSIAYKPNLAFYESQGSAGLLTLEKTVKYIRKEHPDIFIIADAKRGDIGNTAKMYAKTFFEKMDFDAVTIAPYMGKDSVTPFLEYDDKYVILLALTSNPGADDFQYHEEKGVKMFEKIIKTSAKWSGNKKLMYVVGATRAEMLSEIRNIIPDNFILVPGVGSQGGSLEDVAKYGMNDQCGLIVNSSRGIIYAGDENDFAEKAAENAEIIQSEMKELLIKKGLI